MCIDEKLREMSLARYQDTLKVIRDGQTEYGKQILSLSTAVLALSVTFLKNVTGDHWPRRMVVLESGWRAFILAIAAVLLAMQASIAAHKHYLEQDRKLLEMEEQVTETRSRLERVIKPLILVYTCAFAAGILLLVAFAVLNFPEESKVPKAETSHEQSIYEQSPTVPHECTNTVEVFRAPILGHKKTNASSATAAIAASAAEELKQPEKK